jgi:hypothetical protein
MTLDLDALKARLSEYDDTLPRCLKKVARKSNCAPDHLTSKDESYHDYDFTTHSPCIRPEGHADECRNSRFILGWPGYGTLRALIEEVERLREEVSGLRAEVSYLRACVPPTRPTDYGHEVWTAALRAAVAAERAAVVAWLRNEWEQGVGMFAEAARRSIDCIERGEHRREEKP